MMDAIKRKMKGATIEDFFIDAFEGRRQVKETLKTDGTIRLQKAAQPAQEEHQKELTDVEKHLETAKEAFEVGKYQDISAWAKVNQSMNGLAAINKAVAIAYDTVRERVMNSNFKLHKYRKLLKPYDNLPKEIRHRLYEVALYMDDTNQAMKYTPEGMEYKRGNKIVRITNPRVIEGYKSLQTGLKQVLEEKTEVVRNQIIEEFKDLPPGFTSKDVLEYLENNKEDMTSAKIESAENAITTLVNLEKAARIDYFPRIRFGDYFFAVYDQETDELVDFRMLEKIDWLQKWYQPL